MVRGKEVETGMTCIIYNQFSRGYVWFIFIKVDGHKLHLPKVQGIVVLNIPR